VRRILLLLGVVLAVAGCSDGSPRSEPPAGSTTTTDTTTNTTTTNTAAQTMSLRLYFLRDGKLQPVHREVARTPAVADAALLALLRGPEDRERAELALTTAVSGAEGDVVSVRDGIARVLLDRVSGDAAKAQLVYTLTQFPTVREVQFEGQSRRYARADFEALTPAILVESPLPFDRVPSPLRARGTANTFEANFQYELYAPGGTKIAEDFVTATSGTGTRGTFEFAQPFAVDRSGVGKLVVLERSAADGSRIHVVEIPIQLS
jgi:Immunoglobulin-like domain of bacterial spore germination/Sporulation and spore germination/Prokaryotic membrane lipoprotein lipid attachment site